MQIVMILLSLCLSALAVHFYQIGTYGAAATILLVISLLSMALATRKPDSPKEPPVAPAPATPTRTRRLIGSTLLVAGLAGCTLASYKLTVDWYTHLMGWAPVFFGSFVFTCIGVDLSQGYLRLKSSLNTKPLLLRRGVLELAAFLLILTAATWLRAYRLTWFPPPDGTTTIEECQFGNFAYQILNRNYRHWEWMQSSYPGALTFYFLGPSLLHARVHCVIFGILTVIPLYLIIRRLWGVKAALFASALFAACIWHFTYSRYNDAVYHGAFFVTLCLAFLVYSCYSKRLSLIIWVGFIAALELYDYDAYKGTPMLVIIFFAAHWSSRAISALRSKKGGKIKTLITLCAKGWKKPVLLLLIMALVSAPIINQAIKNPNRYLNGIRRATGDNQGKSYYDTSDLGRFFDVRWTRLQRLVKVFYYRASYGDYVAVMIPVAPLFGLMARSLLVLALAYAFLHPLRRHNWFFLIVFFMVIIGGGIFTKNLDVRRLGAAAPYAFILIGLFAGKIFSSLDERHPAKVPGRLLFVLLMACALVNGITNYQYAFGQVYPYFRSPRFFKNQYTVLSKLVNTLGKDEKPVLITEYPLNFFQDNDYFWLIDMRDDGVASGDAVGVPELLKDIPPLDKSIVIFQNPYNLEILAEWMQSLSPGLDFNPFGEETDPATTHGIFCRVTPEQRKEISTKQALTGLDAQYTSYGRGPTISFQRLEPFISYASVPKIFREGAFFSSQNQGYKVRWTGSLNIATSGSYWFSLQSRTGKGSLFIDDKEVPSGSQVKLQAGPHAIRIEGEFPKSIRTGMRFNWKRQETAEWVPVPLWKIASPKR